MDYENLEDLIKTLRVSAIIGEQDLKGLIDIALDDKIKDALDVQNAEDSMFMGAIGSLTVCILSKLTTKQEKWQKGDGKQIEDMFRYLTNKMNEYNRKKENENE